MNKLKDDKAVIALMEAQGNPAAAEVIYIAKNGCKPFQCNKCVLTLACNHKSKDAPSYAVRVLEEVIKEQERRSKEN